MRHDAPGVRCAAVGILCNGPSTFSRRIRLSSGMRAGQDARMPLGESNAQRRALRGGVFVGNGIPAAVVARMHRAGGNVRGDGSL